mmetsp:Transcript_21396/g.69041  ORF Transcript_21396/g.69041 Transcript_21396/m.69041 type:complete len:288 (+) Transcript_21396:832-1695(+)
MLAVPVLPIPPQQATRVGHVNVVGRHSRLAHHERGCAQVGRSGSVEEDDRVAQLVHQRLSVRHAQPQRPEDGRDAHGRSALNVVVVRQVASALGLEQREGVIRIEVLELQDARWAEEVARRVEKLAHNGWPVCVRRVVGRVDERARGGRVPLTLLPQANVATVIADVEAGGVALRTRAADIEQKRHRPSRVEAGAHSVQVQLANRDPHSPCTKVTQPEDAPAIREHHALTLEPPVRSSRQMGDRVLLQHGAYVAALAERDVATARVERHAPELLAGLTDRWSVDDRQ